MKSMDYWRLFVETGAPEMYLLYTSAKRTEDVYVSDGSGVGPESSSLQ